MYPDGLRILVIDHEAGRRELCERVLLDAGFAVTAVSQGISAIRAAATQRVALAVVAIELPGTLDGQNTVRRLRAGQPWLRALFTGEVRRRPVWRGHEPDDFIPSPFHRRDLLGCIFELLHREVTPAFKGECAADPLSLAASGNARLR
jgi:DNA-binding response OmpR family regulator